MILLKISDKLYFMVLKTKGRKTARLSPDYLHAMQIPVRVFDSHREYHRDLRIDQLLHLRQHIYHNPEQRFICRDHSNDYY